MAPGPRFNSSHLSAHESRSRIAILQDARHLTIRAHALGMVELLPWQHYIESLLKQERRWVPRSNQINGSSVAEGRRREISGTTHAIKPRATGAIVEEIDLGSASRDLRGADAEEDDGPPWHSPSSLHQSTLSRTASLIAARRKSQVSVEQSSIDTIIESARSLIDESILAMETLADMVRVLEPPALPPSALETMVLFAAGADTAAVYSPISERSAWRPETESRELEVRENEALQDERREMDGHAMRPTQTRPWAVESSLTSSTGAAAGSTSNEMRSKFNPTEEPQIAFTKGRREKMVSQMAADIARHSEGREQAFESENGYRIYSPVNLEGESLDEEYLFRRSAAASPDANLTRRRSRLDRVSTPVRSDAILRIPTEEFHNYLRGHRRAAEAAIIHRRLVGDAVNANLQSSGGEQWQHLETTMLVDGREIRNIPPYNAEDIGEPFFELRLQERMIITIAIEDGLSLVEAVVTKIWHVFLRSWYEPLSDVALFEIPYRTRMFWHALSGGWSSWMPSSSMLQQIGALFETITGTSGLAIPSITRSDLYAKILDQCLDPLPEHTAPGFSLAMLLRDLPLPVEERSVFLGAFGSSLPDGKLLQMARNWLLYILEVERTRQVSEVGLTIFELRRRRLRMAFAEACRRHRDERYWDSQ